MEIVIKITIAFSAIAAAIFLVAYALPRALDRYEKKFLLQK